MNDNAKPPNPTAPRPTNGRPLPDMQAMAQGEPQAFVLAVAALAAFLFLRAGSSIKLPVTAADVATATGPQAGLLAAACDLRALLAQCPQGRQALGDFGLEPVPEHVEGE